MLEISLKTYLIAGHLFGLCLGLGGAVLMDAIILRFFHQHKMTLDQIQIFSFLSKIVAVGLAILWLTGLGFLLLYYFSDADKLANPKIWAKFTIVCFLTANGVYLHHKILPMLRGFVGYRLLERSTQKQNAMMVVGGTVSVVSWFLPFFLGIAKELNFIVSVIDILLVYGAALTLASFAAALLLRSLANPEQKGSASTYTQPAHN